MPTGTPIQQLEAQAAACDQLGSPFTARLCRLLARHLDRSTDFGARILDWPGDAFADNVALRACGALHAEARSGDEPAVTAVYPPHVASDDALWAAVVTAMRKKDAILAARLDSAPQTNEVARSGLILGGMLHLGAATGQPVELLEVGASAGLNLAFDEYAYDLGDGRNWGNEAAPLMVPCTWRGPAPPLGTSIAVNARAGCDLRPIDPASPGDRSRLISYVWADQQHRLQRVEAALDHAAAKGRTVARADAADWIELRLGMPQVTGTTRVVLHTIVWDYLPASIKSRITARLQDAGAAATSARPLAHLAVESDEVRGSARIDLTVWPGGRTTTLGRGDFHGRWAQWS